MRFLLIACGLLVMLGGVAASCGPKKAYCPDLQNGDCDNKTTPMGGNTGSGGGSDDGSATIITGGTGGQ
jgi:hypothetical protein